MRRRRIAFALAAAVVAAVIGLLLATAGEEERRAPPTSARTTQAPVRPAAPFLEVGLAEQNPHLIAPGPAPPGFGPWRDRVAALRPAVFRLLVDWSKVQPSPDAPPNWTLPADGCLRGRPPCAPYAGIRDLLRAIRERRAVDGGGWEIMATFYGAPAWATTPANGCPPGGTIRIDAYKALLRSLEREARADGAPIRFWAPWNEPNHPTFLAPQRAACDKDAAAISPGAYADLVRAADEELPASAQLVLGEAAGYDAPRADAVGAAEFAAALPPDVACASDIWGQHAYVGRGRSKLAADRERGGHARLLRAVGRALDAHRCGEVPHIWITETGATPGPGSCEAMDRALRAWFDDLRVRVAIQYTFRDDTAFPVGLADARLTRALPAYAAWAAWGGRRAPDGPAPTAPCSMSGAATG